MAVLVWQGGEHSFRLNIGELRALQTATGVGPSALMTRLATNHWFVDDVIETIRLGLIGGGMTEVEAHKIVSRVFLDDPSKLYPAVILAVKILKDAILGEPDDPVGDVGEQTTGNETL